jgi:hypothetical protein
MPPWACGLPNGLLNDFESFWCVITRVPIQRGKVFFFFRPIRRIPVHEGPNSRRPPRLSNPNTKKGPKQTIHITKPNQRACFFVLSGVCPPTTRRCDRRRPVSARNNNKGNPSFPESQTRIDKRRSSGLVKYRSQSAPEQLTTAYIL